MEGARWVLWVGADGMTHAGKDRIRWGQLVIYIFITLFIQLCISVIIPLCYVYLAEECV